MYRVVRRVADETRRSDKQSYPKSATCAGQLGLRLATYLKWKDVVSLLCMRFATAAHGFIVPASSGEVTTCGAWCSP